MLENRFTVWQRNGIDNHIVYFATLADARRAYPIATIIEYEPDSWVTRARHEPVGA